MSKAFLKDLGRDAVKAAVIAAILGLGALVVRQAEINFSQNLQYSFLHYEIDARFRYLEGYIEQCQTSAAIQTMCSEIIRSDSGLGAFGIFNSAPFSRLAFRHMIQTKGNPVQFAEQARNFEIKIRTLVVVDSPEGVRDAKKVVSDELAQLKKAWDGVKSAKRDNIVVFEDALK